MSLLTKASTVTTPTAYSDGLLHSVKPVENLGSEEVTNGDFSDGSTGWDIENTWTIENGAANGNGANGSGEELITDALMSAGTYKVVFEVKNYVSGSVRLYFEGVASENISANGVYTIYRTTTASRNVKFRGTDFYGSIDNVSVKEVLENADFDFARASSATRVNEQGNIEKERENLLLQSNQFDTTWLTINSSVTSGQTGYDGSSDAWLLTSTGGPLYQSISESGVVTFSVYAKGNSGAGFLLRVDQSTQTKLEFNISTGAFISGSNYIDYDSTSIGNGWYRLSVTFLAASTTTAQFRITDGSGTNISGSAYIQDAQLEQGLVATDYIETTTSSVAVGITNDIPRINYEGGNGHFLLEPQRTNLMAYSEYFLHPAVTYTNASGTANAAISPEGVENAHKLQEDSANSRHRFYVTGASAGAGNIVVSGFLKDGNRGYGALHLDTGSDGRFTIIIDLSNGAVVDTMTFASPNVIDYGVEDYGNGWYRGYIVLNKTSTANVYPQIGLASSDSDANSSGMPSYQGDGTHYIYCYGLQVEENSSYPTSYIPCYGAATTRAAETCNNAGNSDLFNDSEGVLYAEIAALEDDLQNRYIGICNGTDDERVLIGFRNSSNSVRSIITGGSASAGIVTFDISDITIFNKIAVRYNASEMNLWINGTEVATDSSFILPTGLSQINFDSGEGSSPFYGKTKMVSTFKEALSDSELECLTSWSSFNRMATAQNYTIE